MRDIGECFLILYSCFFGFVSPSAKTESKDTLKSPAGISSTGVILILAQGGNCNLAKGVKTVWPPGSDELGFSTIYKNPEYIFLDEATNSLDATNEANIMANMQQFYKGRTVVVSAHRLSTVRNADQIVVMDGGEIVEWGTHELLLKKRGRYYELVMHQMTSEIAEEIKSV